MSKYIVDSSAWLEYLDGSSKGEQVRKYFVDAELYTPSTCVAEIIARVLRRELSTDLAKTILTVRSTIISIDFEIANQGGILYAELRKKNRKISLCDALCLAIAKKMNAKILTFDTDFYGIKEAIVLT